VQYLDDFYSEAKRQLSPDWKDGKGGELAPIEFTLQRTDYQSSWSSPSSIPAINEQPEEVGEDKISLEKHTKGTNDSSYIPQTTFTFTFWNKTDKDIRLT
jgi:hypothetical protein